MDYPTAAEIRTWSDVGFAELGYPAVAEDETDRLTVVITRAVPEIERDALEGALLATIPADPEQSDYDRRTPLIQEAIQRMVEYKAAAGQMEYLETAADFDMTQSVSAGGYSQTNRAIGAGRNVLHPWPLLNRLLLGIRFFDSAGRPREDTPSVSVPTPDWEHQRAIMNARRYGVPYTGVAPYAGPYALPVIYP